MKIKKQMRLDVVSVWLKVIAVVLFATAIMQGLALGMNRTIWLIFGAGIVFYILGVIFKVSHYYSLKKIKTKKP